MKKVLIVSGHTDIQNDSFVNKRILEEVKKRLPQVEIDSLCELYPDFKIDVAAEQKKVVDADVIVFQFPLFWYAKPSILQSWEEDVFVHGFSHGSNGTVLNGKKLILSFTTGAPAEVYTNEGFAGCTLNDLLAPATQGTTRLTGMTAEPFVITTGVSYALRNDPEQLKALEAAALDHTERLVAQIEKSCQ